MEYIQWVEIELKTQKSFAEHKGKHRNQLERWKLRWKRNGLLEKVRSVTGAILSEDSRVEHRKILRRMDQIVSRLWQLSEQDKRVDVALQATMELYRIARETDAEQPKIGSEESAYIDMIEAHVLALDPMSISRNVKDKYTSDEGELREFPDPGIDVQNSNQ